MLSLDPLRKPSANRFIQMSESRSLKHTCIFCTCLFKRRWCIWMLVELHHFFGPVSSLPTSVPSPNSSFLLSLPSPSHCCSYTLPSETESQNHNVGKKPLMSWSPIFDLPSPSSTGTEHWVLCPAISWTSPRLKAISSLDSPLQY